MQLKTEIYLKQKEWMDVKFIPSKSGNIVVGVVVQILGPLRRKTQRLSDIR